MSRDFGTRMAEEYPPLHESCRRKLPEARTLHDNHDIQSVLTKELIKFRQNVKECCSKTSKNMKSIPNEHRIIFTDGSIDDQVAYGEQDGMVVKEEYVKLTNLQSSYLGKKLFRTM